MVKNERLDALDNVLLALFGASFAIPFFIQFYGLDTRFVVIPSCCYAGWILFIGYIKPKVSFGDFPERSRIERMRGWSYVLGLPVCLVVNFIFNVLVPKSLITLVIGASALGFALQIVFTIIRTKLFRKETNCMNAAQYGLLVKMLTSVGGSMIYTSVAIVFVTVLTTWTSFPLLIVIGYLAVSAILLGVGYQRHRKSSKYADDLAASLKKTSWVKRLKRKHK